MRKLSKADEAELTSSLARSFKHVTGKPLVLSKAQAKYFQANGVDISSCHVMTDL